MAKSGIKYYNIDTDRYSDRRIMELLLECGLRGLAIYDCILSEIYREEGYYVRDDNMLVLCAVHNLLMDSSKTGEVKNVINCCCNAGLFNKDLRASGKILTSHSIQLRYMNLKARLKHKIEKIPEEYLLVERSEMPPVFAQLYKSSEKTPKSSEDLNENSEDLNENSALIKLKEKKEKENKENVCVNAHARITPTPAASSDDTHRFIFEIEKAFFLRGYLKPQHIAKKMLDYYVGEGKDLTNLPLNQAVAKVTNWNPKKDTDYVKTASSVAEFIVKITENMCISISAQQKIIESFVGISWCGDHLTVKFDDKFTASVFKTYCKDYKELLLNYFNGTMNFIDVEPDDNN